MNIRNLSIKRLAGVIMVVKGLKRAPRPKDKRSAIKAIGRVSKQNFVLALARSGGVTTDEIEALYSISRAYARDIVAKLAQRGVSIARGEDGSWVA